MKTKFFKYITLLITASCLFIAGKIQAQYPVLNLNQANTPAGYYFAQDSIDMTPPFSTSATSYLSGDKFQAYIDTNFNNTASQPKFVEGSVNFKIRTGTPDISFSSPPSEISLLISKYSITTISRLFTIEHDVLRRIYTLKFDTSINNTSYPDSVLADSLVSDLKKIAYIETAEREFKAQLFQTINDPEYSVQSYLQIINANPAWDVVLTNSVHSPVIAIIDNGFDINHDDLNPNLWINLGEDPTDNIDNDFNNYLNDINGWNFVDNNNDLSLSIGCNTHGSSVAGIAGARTNNYTGVASISDCGGSVHPKLMFLKVYGAYGSGGTVNQIAEAIVYATEMGADVINMSLGGPYPIDYMNPFTTNTGQTVFTLQDVIDYANSRNVVCVAAAGNEGQMTTRWPCNLNHVIGVGATEDNDHITDFSNYGTQIDVMAPGLHMEVCDDMNGYTTLNGTSMASPLVAGLAALIRTEYPFMPPEAIESCIENRCVNIDDINQYPEHFYWDNPTPYDNTNNLPHNHYQYNLGHGRIDAYAAVQCINSNIGTIAILPSTPCPDEPTTIFYYSNTDIQPNSYHWSITPAPQSISSTTIYNPQVIFGNIGSYTVTLNATATDNTPIHVTQVFNITSLPTAQISSINNLNQTCDGSSQSIFVQFTGHPPFSITLSDGIQNYTFNNLLQYQSTVYVDIFQNHNTISVASVSDLYCTNNQGNSITFNNIVKCCDNLVENGDFETPIPIYSSDFPTSTSTGILQFYTDYQYSNSANINNITVLPAINYYTSNLPQNGSQSLFCDGYAALNTSHTPPSEGIDANIWNSTSIQVNPNQNYYFSFWFRNSWNTMVYTEYNMEYAPGIRLFINGQQMDFNNLQIPQNFYYAPVQPDRWIHLCGVWSSATNTTATMELKNLLYNNIDNAGGGGNDLLIDNIELRCIDNFNVVASDDGIDCPGHVPSINATATGGLQPYTYSWSPATGLSNSTIANPTANPPATTTYTVAAADANGCVATDEVTVIVNALSINATPNQTICQGETATLTATGGGTYLWSNSATTSSISVSPSATTNYSVTVTGTNGCTATGQVTITVNSLPTINAGSNASVCLGSSSIIGPTGVYSSTTFSWSPAYGLNDASIQQPTADPAVTTVYTLTSTNQGCSSTSSVAVTVLNLPAIAYTTTNETCFGSENGSIDLTVTDNATPFSYNWENSDNVSYGTTQDITGLAADTYSVSVTDANSCVSTEDILVGNTNNTPWPYHPVAGTDKEIGKSVAVDASTGNVYAVGYFQGHITFDNAYTTNGGQDIYIVKFDECGSILWSKQIGGTGPDCANKVIVDNSGNIIVTGYFSSTVNFGGVSKTSNGDVDLFVAKYNSAGTLLWVNSYGSTGVKIDIGNDVTVDASNNVYVAGTVGNGLTGDVYLQKFDAGGSPINQYIDNLGTLMGLGITYCSTCGTNAKILVTGQNANNIFIAKLDDGLSNYNRYDYSLIAGLGQRIVSYYDASGPTNYAMVAGYKNVGSSRQIEILKANVANLSSYSEVISGSNAGYDAATDIKLDQDGNIFITGQFLSSQAVFPIAGGITINNSSNCIPDCTPDNFVAKYSQTSSSFDWVVQSGSTYEETSTGLSLIGNGFGYITGSFQNTGIFGTASLTAAADMDMFVARMHDLGSTGQYRNIASSENTVDSVLYRTDIDDNIIIYPNPANNVLYVDCKFIADKILITDLLGNKIMNLPVVDKKTQIDVSNFKNGMYFLKIEIPDKVFIRKFSVIK